MLTARFEDEDPPLNSVHIELEPCARLVSDRRGIRSPCVYHRRVTGRFWARALSIAGWKTSWSCSPRHGTMRPLRANLLAMREMRPAETAAPPPAWPQSWHGNRPQSPSCGIGKAALPRCGHCGRCAGDSKPESRQMIQGIPGAPSHSLGMPTINRLLFAPVNRGLPAAVQGTWHSWSDFTRCRPRWSVYGESGRRQQPRSRALQ